MKILQYEDFLTKVRVLANITLCLCRLFRVFPVSHLVWGPGGRQFRKKRPANLNLYGLRCFFVGNVRRPRRPGNVFSLCFPVGICTNIFAPTAGLLPDLKRIRLKERSGCSRLNFSFAVLPQLFLF
jgi:hypothetical protein